MTVHLAVAGDVFIDVSLWCPFSHEMSWMRYVTELSQFLRISLPTVDPNRATREGRRRKCFQPRYLRYLTASRSCLLSTDAHGVTELGLRLEPFVLRLAAA